ncbi:uridine kinase-like protein [Tanacetum coccineum]|uniref:Uridine kinase-like protein n=1 Tax=Tanacetum coccineum TaxID=301880 RepID=A0ABQ5HTP4_9ASTR
MKEEAFSILDLPIMTMNIKGIFDLVFQQDVVSCTSDSLAATDIDSDSATSPATKRLRDTSDKDILGQNSSTKRKLVLSDIANVLRGSPYFVMGNYVVLMAWDLDKTLDEMEFSKGEFWVQVHDLPLGMLTSECASKFAEKIGRLVEVGCFGEHEFLRFRVEVDVTKALVPGFFVPRKDGRETWAQLKYEGLGDFCYNCGCLGHCRETCVSMVVDEKRWTEDMRASLVQSVQTLAIMQGPAITETPRSYSRALVRHSSYSVTEPLENNTPEQSLTHPSLPPGFSIDDVNLSDPGSMLCVKQEELMDSLQVGEVLTSGSGSVKEVAKKHHHLEKAGLYDAKLSMRGRITVAKDIQSKLLNTPRYALFKETCFGAWLDVQDTTTDGMLVHAILQTQYIPEQPVDDVILFRIQDHELRFSREEFCLITGLPFGSMGQLQEMSSDNPFTDNPFRDRVFGHIPVGKPVALSDVQAIFQNSLDMLTDLDAIRICLLLLLELGFAGRDPRRAVNVNLLRLVEDLDSWNTFPWGSYIWSFTYHQLRDSIKTRRKSHLATLAQGNVPKYKLSGFIWAFKIWILEVFPFARQFYTQDPDAIPRAIGWQNSRPIRKENICDFINFRERFTPVRELLPSDAERSTSWWRSSRSFFDSEVDDVTPSAKRARVASPSSQEDLSPGHGDDPHPHYANTTKPRSDTTNGTSHQTFEERLVAIEKDDMLLKHGVSWVEDDAEVIPRVDGRESWAPLKYEGGLSDLCYLCGCLGHPGESCTNEDIAKHPGKWWTSDMHTSSVEHIQKTSTHVDYIPPPQTSTIKTPNSHSLSNVNTPTITTPPLHHSNYCVTDPIKHMTPEQSPNHPPIPPGFSPFRFKFSDVNFADTGLRLSIKHEGEIVAVCNQTEKPSQVKEVANKHPHVKNVIVDHAGKEVELYDACLSVRGRMPVARDIRIKLINTPRYALFKETCFGAWLDLQYTMGDPKLIHGILQTQYIPEQPVDDEILFRIHDHKLRFSREEFCLITGLPFGPMRWLPETSPDIPFRARVFGHIPSGRPVFLSDVLAVFQNSLDTLTDLDAVRICLLLLLELAFDGRDVKVAIDVKLLRLVEDLDSWNTFPWGSYLWPLTYQQLRDSIPTRRETHLAMVAQGKLPSYALSGFIWVFQIWIFEVFPIARRFNSRDPDAIPRAIGWRRSRPIRKENVCDFIDFQEGFEPLSELVPTDAERSTPWWRASRRFFDGIVDDVPPSPKRAASLPNQEDLAPHLADEPLLHHSNTTITMSETITNHETVEEQLVTIEKYFNLNNCVPRVDASVEDRETT